MNTPIYDELAQGLETADDSPNDSPNDAPEDAPAEATSCDWCNCSLDVGAPRYLYRGIDSRTAARVPLTACSPEHLLSLQADHRDGADAEPPVPTDPAAKSTAPEDGQTPDVNPDINTGTKTDINTGTNTDTKTERLERRS